MNVLLSCYSCCPRRGSEPGVGWNVAVHLAKRLEAVHVVTSSEFQKEIEAEVASGRTPPSLHFHFYEIPGGRWWWRHCQGKGIQVHYYLWQLLADAFVRRLHQRHRFDVAHHITFVCYWMPSCLRNLSIPYVFGPVGGADNTPPALLKSYSLRGKVFEWMRMSVRRIAEHDPVLRKTLRRAKKILVTSESTRARYVAIGIPPQSIGIAAESALSQEEFDYLRSLSMPASPPFCFLGFGRLVSLKGYHQAIRAFALFHGNHPDSKLLLIGGGPEESRLKKLARSLQVDSAITFTGNLKRADALKMIEKTHLVLHPCHHETGGCALREVMAAGRPAICLNWAGTATTVGVHDMRGESSPIVNTGCAYAIGVGTDDEVVERMAEAMCMATRPSGAEERPPLYAMGQAAQRRMQAHYLWERKAEEYIEHYREICPS